MQSQGQHTGCDACAARCHNRPFQIHSRTLEHLCKLLRPLVPSLLEHLQTFIPLCVLLLSKFPANVLEGRLLS